jgi:uncharacterized membrane protein
VVDCGQATDPVPYFCRLPVKGKNMSDYVTMSVVGATYDNVEAAESDFDLVKAMYFDLDLMDTFDAAVLKKNEKGKVKIVEKHEQPTRDGAWLGAGWGLATGLVAALFPAAAIGTGLLAMTTGTGAALGALAGHAVGGMSRGDLKDLGEGLDVGEAGLIVIAATDVGERVADTLAAAEHLFKSEIKADRKELEKEIKHEIKETSNV